MANSVVAIETESVATDSWLRQYAGQDRFAEFVQRRCVRRRCRSSVETLRVKKADFVTDRFFETCDTRSVNPQ